MCPDANVQRRAVPHRMCGCTLYPATTCIRTRAHNGRAIVTIIGTNATYMNYDYIQRPRSKPAALHKYATLTHSVRASKLRLRIHIERFFSHVYRGPIAWIVNNCIASPPTRKQNRKKYLHIYTYRYL